MTADSFVVLAIEALLGFLVALIAGWILLALLPRYALRQTASEDAPERHRSKTGTPTMGGIAILAAIACSACFAHDASALALFVLVFGCALVGIVDDLIGIKSGTNAGLRARTKFLATALVAVIFIRMLPSAASYAILHAPLFTIGVPYWLWILLGVLAITGAAHAVNLTDGLDGLAAGSLVPPLYVFWALAMLTGYGAHEWPAVVAFAIGGCFGFLVYNRHPARMIMGDTGSLALGALLAGVAILDGEMLLLVVAGGLFVAEALSVMLQVFYFKLTGGRRIFLMSPLHHHFELAGWSERTVTLRFWLASLLCSVVGWIVGNL